MRSLKSSDGGHRVVQADGANRNLGTRRQCHSESNRLTEHVAFGLDGRTRFGMTDHNGRRCSCADHFAVQEEATQFELIGEVVGHGSNFRDTVGADDLVVDDVRTFMLVGLAHVTTAVR